MFSTEPKQSWHKNWLSTYTEIPTVFWLFFLLIQICCLYFFLIVCNGIEWISDTQIQRSRVALTMVLKKVLLNLQKISTILREIIIFLFCSYYSYHKSSNAEQCTGFSLCKAFCLLSVDPKFHHGSLVHTLILITLCYHPQNMLTTPNWFHIYHFNPAKDHDIRFSTPLNTRC